MAQLQERLDDILDKECGKGIVGLDVERLPKATFAKEMVFEARAMAQLQFCDAVLEDDNLTLHSDGTTKFGHHYGSYDVSFGEGKVFTLGVRETTLRVLEEIVQDLVDLGGQAKVRLDLGCFLTKIKNGMSDRHSVQKKFNELLADFRGKFLPAVRGDWDSLSLTQRVPQYIAGVKSLGIIDKVITGPLWRAMEKEKHVLAMNERYDRLLECLAKWGKDSTDLLTGSDLLYSDVPLKKNSVYDSLMKPCELDGMVKQLLEMLCSSFKMLTILKKADQDRARKLLLGKENKSVGGLAESASELDQRLSELKSAIGLAPVDAVEAFKSRLQPLPAKKARLTSDSNIKLPEGLVGKRIEHHTKEEGKVDWYKGTVVGAKGAKYFVRYDRFPRVYSYKVKEIEEDIQTGDLQVLILFP
ncbi:hypothetical protein BSL78_30166, partial [Apostichopus japonicus]